MLEKEKRVVSRSFSFSYIVFKKTVHSFDNGYVGNQPVAWKEHCVKYGLQVPDEHMDRCAGCRDVTENAVKNLKLATANYFSMEESKICCLGKG